MSIGTRIFLGCICMTLVTSLVGVTSHVAQVRLGHAARGLYDDAFIPMNDIRSAQAALLSLSSSLASKERTDAFVEQLQSTLDALDVAKERAMSRSGERCAARLIDDVSQLQTVIRSGSRVPTRSELSAIEQEVDVAVGVYAHDALNVRKSVEAILHDTQTDTIVALIASLAVAILITILLSRTIVPPIRYAVEAATAIANGRLDLEIRRRGPRETGVLLSALSVMRGSIAEKIAHIELLMRQQASSHAAELETQNTRFETALNHMTLGLRMYDAEGRLLVQNKKFAELFSNGPPPDALDLISGPTPEPSFARAAPGSRASLRTLDDGRTISIAGETMADGGSVMTYEDVTDRQRDAERLSYLARHDTLTGLPNRSRLRDEIETRLRSLRDGKSLAVLCLDLDRFKLVNDTLGHPVGDLLLRQVAARLGDTVAADDFVVRLGGDEFAVLQISEDQPAQAVALAERLGDAIRGSFGVEGHEVSVGVSIGIVCAADGDDGPDDLLRNADLAMYHAKGDGRGSYRMFEPDMETKIRNRRLLEIELRDAVAQEKLEVFYQPIVDARSGRPVGFEALLRWFHPVRGFVPPAEFIPLAEETGLIHTLGPWVLDRACREASRWPAGIRVAVNLSALQFRGPGLVKDVTSALRRWRLPAARLELEITESVMLQDDETTLGVLHELHDLGARISMDDFGTGYSSLRYLCRFPFDTIKIDRSFINNMREGSDGFAVVTATINLARTLRMEVVAEGVETDEQMTLLREAGCREMQGFLFGRPRPSGDVDKLLLSGPARASALTAVA